MNSSSALLRFLRLAPTALLGLLFCAASPAQSSSAFPVESPTGITVGPDGAIWFANYFPKTIGRIDASGTIREFPTPRSALSLASGPDGNLWYTTSSGSIGRMTTSGTATEFSPPNSQSRPSDITPGPDGNLWFIETATSAIGRVTTSGEITEFPVPAPPGDLTAGPDGSLWFTEPAVSRIGRITTAGVVTEFAVSSFLYPVRIVAGPDDNLWFTESGDGWVQDRVGRITPAGLVTEFDPGFVDAGSGIVAGADGNLWVAGIGSLTRLTTTGARSVYPVPMDDENTYSTHPFSMVAAPDGSIWVTNYGAHQIVRFAPGTSAPSPCVTGGSTLCLGNGRFRVTADWKAGDGSTGHGRGVALTANSGYFWFFDKDNVEMVVKVLDGCAANQHQWVFAAGLTNVEVTTTVTDTFSGLSKTYSNPQGTPFAPVQDTAAFEACP